MLRWGKEVNADVCSLGRCFSFLFWSCRYCLRDKLINLSCMWLSKINNLILIRAIYGANAVRLKILRRCGANIFQPSQLTIPGWPYSFCSCNPRLKARSRFLSHPAAGLSAPTACGWMCYCLWGSDFFLDFFSFNAVARVRSLTLILI